MFAAYKENKYPVLSLFVLICLLNNFSLNEAIRTERQRLIIGNTRKLPSAKSRVYLMLYMV